MNHQVLRRNSDVETEHAGSWNPLISFPGSQSQSTQPVATKAFVAAMRGAVTGVNIVTTDGPAGRYGLTVSAFVSVSAEPPTVLVCINRRSPACAAILKNRRFCVNVLSTGQRALADTFAGIPSEGEAYDFGAGSWKPAVKGAPLLDDCVANFNCTVASAVDAGSHTIFIGTVVTVHNKDTSPLLYTNRFYGRACCAAQCRN